MTWGGDWIPLVLVVALVVLCTALALAGYDWALNATAMGIGVLAGFGLIRLAARFSWWGESAARRLRWAALVGFLVLAVLMMVGLVHAYYGGSLPAAGVIAWYAAVGFSLSASGSTRRQRPEPPSLSRR